MRQAREACDDHLDSTRNYTCEFRTFCYRLRRANRADRPSLTSVWVAEGMGVEDKLLAVRPAFPPLMILGKAHRHRTTEAQSCVTTAFRMRRADRYVVVHRICQTEASSLPARREYPTQSILDEGVINS